MTGQHDPLKPPATSAAPNAPGDGHSPRRELPRSPLVANKPRPAPEPQPPSPLDATNPTRALISIRQKMERVADEFAQGKLNRAQFNAVYRRYHEQRSIIEKLMARDPNSDAWRQVVATHGQTVFLKSQLHARPLSFTVFVHQHDTPLLDEAGETTEVRSITGTRLPTLDFLVHTMRRVWRMANRPPNGLGRLVIPTGGWLLVATGTYAATCTAFSSEPSITQARLVRDLHADFERANRESLSRGWLEAERMVFPQRALVET